jgi:hypothetical protein
VADLPMDRFQQPPPRFDPLLGINPRRLAEINAGGPRGSGETVVHPAQRRRVELSCFALYPLPSNGVRIELMEPSPPSVMTAPRPSPTTTRSPA